MFHTKVVEEIKTHVLCSIFIFLVENRTVYEIMWKNIAQADRTQKTIYYDTCALHAGYPRLQTHTHNM